MINTTLNAMTEAEKKAWKSLAGYKFWMFGYHAAEWIKYKNLLVKSGVAKAKRFPDPFRRLVHVARLELKRWDK